MKTSTATPKPLSHDFRELRARPGKGARKKLLIEELRMTERLIDHEIIATVAGCEEAKHKRAVLEAERDAQILELTQITRPAP